MFDVRAPRRARLRRRSRTATLLVMAATVTGAGIVSVVNPAPRLMWNGSASAPVGLYRIDASATIRWGDLVLVHPPEAARKLAVERGYLPADVPLVKRKRGRPPLRRLTPIEAAQRMLEPC